MPYIITTKVGRELHPAHPRYSGHPTVERSRRAVATLDEARDYMRPILAESYPHGPVGNAAALRDLEGFSPILLDDGTVIEVQSAEWADLTEYAVTRNPDALAATIIAAYNTAQGERV